MAFYVTIFDVVAWLAISAFSLLMLSELLSARYGKIYSSINPKKLKLVSYFFMVAFFIFVGIKLAYGNL